MASIPLAILSSSISSFNRAQSACDGDDDDDDDDDDALAAVAVMLMTIMMTTTIIIIIRSDHLDYQIN